MIKHDIIGLTWFFLKIHNSTLKLAIYWLQKFKPVAIHLNPENTCMYFGLKI